MIETGRLTAPPQFEVALVTFRALDRSHKASLRDSSVSPRSSASYDSEAHKRRAEVCMYRTPISEQMLVSAASATPTLSRPR